MKHVTKASLSVLSVWLPMAAQSLTVPHVVDGGGWQSTIVLTNTAATAGSASLVFHKETTGGNTQPWTPTFQEVVSTSGLSLPSGSSLFLRTAGTAQALTQGWAELTADPGVTGYVVFTIRVPGHQDQEGTAPIVAAANRLLVPYDDSNGFVTGIAVVNPTGTAEDLSVGFRSTAGGVAVTTLAGIPAGGHVSFVLSTQFPFIKGHAGLAEFYSQSGKLTMIALRINPTQSFTAAPVYLQTGFPLIQADSSNPYDPTTNPSDPMNPYDPYGYMVKSSAGSVH